MKTFLSLESILSESRLQFLATYVSICNRVVFRFSNQKKLIVIDYLFVIWKYYITCCTSKDLSSLFSAAIMSERGERAASNKRCPFCKFVVNFSGNRSKMLNCHIYYHCVDEDGRNKPTKNLAQFQHLKNMIGQRELNRWSQFSEQKLRIFSKVKI